MSYNNINNKKVIYYESRYRRKATKANWFKSINNLINNEKSQAAESELAKFLHYYPYDVPALYEYAKSLSRKAEYNGAIEVLTNILSIQKEEPYHPAKKNDYSNYINNNLYKEKTNNKILKKTKTEKFYDRYNKRG